MSNDRFYYFLTYGYTWSLGYIKVSVMVLPSFGLLDATKIAQILQIPTACYSIYCYFTSTRVQVMNKNTTKLNNTLNIKSK